MAFQDDVVFLRKLKKYNEKDDPIGVGEMITQISTVIFLAFYFLMWMTAV